MDVVEPCIVDLCTGSGAIALALAQEVPRSRVYAVELSEDALVWTRRNMAGSRVELRQGDALTAFPDLDGQVDLVISNPPYIPLTEWEYITPEARDHDPQMALFSGEDGLDLIRGLERTAHRLLRPGGVVVVEPRHPGRPGAVDLTEERGWADAADHPDLNNRPRFATARKALP
ncbi:Release factor glutamine methyltransferase OS=Streptomyces fumanus OX=67302 GN=prmC PE=3 SV=1 [Streptomyces fumanus]